MPKTDDVIAGMTQAIIDIMENEPDNWTKPWAGVSGMPHNPQTGTIYSGGNVFTLMIDMWSRQTGDPRYSTYKGWEKLGAQVMKGETGNGILYVTKAWFNDTTKKWKNKKPADSTGWNQKYMLKAYAVFHASQVEGAPEWEQPMTSPDIDVDVHRNWFQSIGADWVEQAQDRAFYSPSKDQIVTPLDTQFAGEVEWFGVVAHEFTHWTGHSSRLDREGVRGFSDRKSYAYEELVAELGASLLAVALGVESKPRPDHAHYIKSWLKALDNDYKFIWDAAGLASKAVNYILDNADKIPQPEGEESAENPDTISV